jgi:hypothetical protein
MIQSLKSNQFEEFLNRFWHFNDGVIRSITLNYCKDGSKEATLTIATRDSLTHDDEGWVSVDLVVLQITEMMVQEQVKTTMSVLSQGIHICWLNDVLAIEFGGNCDSPRTMEELRSSSGYITGKELRFEVRPYK